MASFEENIEIIRNGVKGRDVRTAIADALMEFPGYAQQKIEEIEELIEHGQIHINMRKLRIGDYSMDIQNP